jgi:hypothetical protein
MGMEVVEVGCASGDAGRRHTQKWTAHVAVPRLIPRASQALMWCDIAMPRLSSAAPVWSLRSAPADDVFLRVRGGVRVDIVLVKVWQRIRDIFEFYLRRDGAELEIMDLDRFDEAWQRDLLKLCVDEVADLFGQGLPVRTASDGLPVEIDRHEKECS